MHFPQRLAKAMRCTTLLAATVLAGAPAAWAANVEGQLDPHFSGGGRAWVNFDQHDAAKAVAIQADGKIVLAGTISHVQSPVTISGIGVTRLWPNGTIDTSFGQNGKVAIYPGFGQLLDVHALAIQPNGKLVIAGFTEPNTITGKEFYARRLNADGSTDTSFGNGGSIALNFGSGPGLNNPGSSEANSIGLASDGSIYLGGVARVFATFQGQTTSQLDFAIAKLTPAGSLDTNFAGGGMQTVAFDQGGDNADVGTALAIQSDGKVLLAGQVRKATQSNEFGAVRLLANGARDTSFGNMASGGFNFFPGQSVFSVASSACLAELSSIALAEFTAPAPVRGIYLGGTTCSTSLGTIGEIVGIRDDGTLNTGFGTSPVGGSVQVDLDPAYDNQHLTSLVWQPPVYSAFSHDATNTTARLLASGYGRDTTYNNIDMLMTRLDFGGNVDTSFGTAGHQFVYFNYAGGVGDDPAYASAMVGNGYLVVAGSSQRNASGDTDFAITRLLVGDRIFHDGVDFSMSP